VCFPNAPARYTCYENILSDSWFRHHTTGLMVLTCVYLPLSGLVLPTQQVKNCSCCRSCIVRMHWHVWDIVIGFWKYQLLENILRNQTNINQQPACKRGPRLRWERPHLLSKELWLLKHAHVSVFLWNQTILYRAVNQLASQQSLYNKMQHQPSGQIMKPFTQTLTSRCKHFYESDKRS